MKALLKVFLWCAGKARYFYAPTVVVGAFSFALVCLLVCMLVYPVHPRIGVREIVELVIFMPLL